jgi:hypothetical protein
MLHGLQMDNVLMERSITTRGSKAVSVVFVSHPGLAIFPVADQLQGSDVDCAAAVVPLHMLDSGNDDTV